MAANQERTRTIRHLALPIREIGCAAAAPSIDHALRDVPGVTRVYVNPVTEMAYIEYRSGECDESALRAALDRAGYLEKPPEPPRAANTPGSSPWAGVRRFVSRVWRAGQAGRNRAVHPTAEPR